MTAIIEEYVENDSAARVDREDLSVSDFLVLREVLTGILEENISGPVPEPQEVCFASRYLTDAHRRWLMVLDLCATPEALRLGLQRRAPDDESLIVLMHYLLRLGRPVDHDRFDWVLTYLFKRRLETGALPGVGNIGAQIIALFPNFPQPPLTSQARDLIKKLSAALEEIKAFTSFPQLTASGLLAKGRQLKEQFEEERYHPAVLSAVVSYNLVLGKAFQSLFDESALRSRELAKRLIKADYRSNVEHMSKVVAPAAETTARVEGHATLLEVTPAQHEVIHGPMVDPIQALGLDDGREAQKLRFTMRSLVAYFENEERRAEGVVRWSDLRLPLADWETRALSTDYPPQDKSFRADFARRLAKAVAFLYRLAEERDQLARKASSEYLWKPHYDALLWLYARGKEHVENMQVFARDVIQRGLPEKGQQVHKSAARLSETLEHAARYLTTATGECERPRSPATPVDALLPVRKSAAGLAAGLM
jgi:hypothetical protein